MGRARTLQEIRVLRFEALLDRHERGELSQGEAAELLGMSERTFRRHRDRYREDGVEGLRDRRLGKPSSRRAAVAEIQRMLGLYREEYGDFTVKHFHEQLVKRHDYKLGYTVTRLALHAAGLVRPAPRRSTHRKKRPRRPLPGMMLHQDASRFAWLPGEARQYDLVVTLDDATSEIYSAILVAEEGTGSTFRALAEVIAAKGLFCALYTDRGSHYFHTPEAGGQVSSRHLTQVGRALAQLGIKHIAAYSPEARGRSERVFRTLQDRLPKEMRLAGIATLEAANRWLATHYIAAHNARFAVPAEQAGTAFTPDAKGLAREVLTIQEERRVGNDNTVKWRRLVLQIPPSPLRPHFVRASVRVQEYPDGAIALFHGPHRLADYDAAGRLLASPLSAPPKPLRRRNGCGQASGLPTAPTTAEAVI
ncbi:MAG TPA: ISNCY family transposase [Alphaproteobacteria bacterium]|jgi:transposase|nr:ISNCY family transposase [Alphaproteobacteria bacterium]